MIIRIQTEVNNLAFISADVFLPKNFANTLKEEDEKVCEEYRVRQERKRAEQVRRGIDPLPTPPWRQMLNDLKPTTAAAEPVTPKARPQIRQQLRHLQRIRLQL